jgi:phytoene dehydrogenase-like protein
MFPFLMFMRKWSKVSVADYIKRFKSPLLRRIISLDEDVTQINSSALGIPLVLAFLNQRTAGYVIGGSLALVGYIQRRYLDLGGELHFKVKVEKILTENGQAVGIRLTDGTEHRGDIVVSAADGYATIFNMLEGKYIDDTIRSYYGNLTLYPPLIYIGLGIDRTFDDIPPSAEGLTFPLENPVTIAGQEHKTLTVQIYNFDSTLAPKGKTLARLMLYTDYDYWEELYKDSEQYKAEKEQIADTIISILDKRFPGLASQVEMCDVATPMTWVRYTGNWRGAYEGWVRDMKAPMLMKKKLPGLDNFYMAGQWVNPGGGMPAAVMSGRHTIQMICKKDNKKFVTSTP